MRRKPADHSAGLPAVTPDSLEHRETEHNLAVLLRRRSNHEQCLIGVAVWEEGQDSASEKQAAGLCARREDNEKPVKSAWGMSVSGCPAREHYIYLD